MKIYTRSGDKGMTSLANGHRVKKCDDRVEAYGTLDELCSHIGLLAAMCPEELRENLYNIQRRIFAINSALALLKEPKGLPTAETIEAMEQLIDSVDTSEGRFCGFVLPGGTMPAAQADVCRTVCRRAERAIWRLGNEALPHETMVYINRLSDFFFLFARYLNKFMGSEEIKL